MTGPFDLGLLDRCFGGAIPAVLATASADGTPNVIYLTRAHRVDAERLALSNQFLSKTARNLVENPRASLLLVDPLTHDEFLLSLLYERTERRGRVFERLRSDVDAMAALSNMQDVFRLRAAAVFRVTSVEQVAPNPAAAPPDMAAAIPIPAGARVAALAELSGRLARCGDLDSLVDVTVDALDRLLGYAHVHLLLVDETGDRLYTIASRGYDADSVGAEVPVGDGIVGMAAATCTPVRIGGLHQLAKYSSTVRRSFTGRGDPAAGPELPMPGLPGAESRLAVPAMTGGHLVGVLVAESTATVAFDDTDEAVVSIVAALVAAAAEGLRADNTDDLGELPPPDGPAAARAPAGDAPLVRHFASDGSTFLDGEYLIKGVAGRILWSLLREHQATGRTQFTNRELRLDPSLELPGFKDNLESRLILLKRRLDERGAPVRLVRTGRGRFCLEVEAELRLEAADA